MKVGIAARAAEQAKYRDAYALETYRMGAKRMADALADLATVTAQESYLDVGCGRGEMLDHALSAGFAVVKGVEVVPDLIDGDHVIRGECHRLPLADSSFDVVTMFDVIEHLLPGDDEAACRELARVAKCHVFVTANNRPSHLPDGTDLHVNRRDYEEWDALFRTWFNGRVVWLDHYRSFASQGWRVDL